MTRNTIRHDFKDSTKRQIAKRAGYFCSDPNCRRLTVGATSDGESVMMLGAACHICAAAPGGPRYDAAMSKDERRSVQNGIWMCNIHAKSIDTHDPKFTVQLLRDWKRLAEEYSHRRALYNEDVQPVIVSEGEIGERLNAAAAADLEVFRRSDKWPSSDVPLTVHMKQLDQPVHTTALARALSQLGDLILIPPPGMGKTST